MRLWRFMILLEMMFEVVIGVMIMEVDKVTDMKILIEDLTDSGDW